MLSMAAILFVLACPGQPGSCRRPQPRSGRRVAQPLCSIPNNSTARTVRLIAKYNRSRSMAKAITAKITRQIGVATSSRMPTSTIADASPIAIPCSQAAGCRR